MKHLSARLAIQEDECKLAGLVPLAAIEMGESHLIDPTRPQPHMATKLKQGPCFVLEADGEIIGVITTNPVDLGHRIAQEAIEVSHTFVRKDHRCYKAISLLFDAVEAYADANRLVVFYHELNFPAALRREPSQSDRLGKLYERRKYRPVGFSLARHPSPEAGGKPPYRRVGRTYLYLPSLREEAEGLPLNVCPAPKAKDDDNHNDQT